MVSTKRNTSHDPEYSGDFSIWSRIFSGPLTGKRREQYTWARFLQFVIAIPTVIAGMVLLSGVAIGWKALAGITVLAGVIASAIVWERKGNYVELLIDEYADNKTRSERRKQELLDFAAKVQQERRHE